MSATNNLVIRADEGFETDGTAGNSGSPDYKAISNRPLRLAAKDYASYYRIYGIEFGPDANISDRSTASLLDVIIGNCFFRAARINLNSSYATNTSYKVGSSLFRDYGTYSVVYSQSDNTTFEMVNCTFVGNGYDFPSYAQISNHLPVEADFTIKNCVGSDSYSLDVARDFINQAVTDDAIQTTCINQNDGDANSVVDPATDYIDWANEDYGIADHCHFLGWRPNEELPLLYSLMDVLVLPSLFEGLPRAIMECSAMGVPAVATEVKGNREAVEHGRNGLLVPFADVPALSDAITELLTDKEKAQRMGEAGRRIARERFDERHVFEKVRQNTRG